jgi:hypothetical protein
MSEGMRPANAATKSGTAKAIPSTANTCWSN